VDQPAWVQGFGYARSALNEVEIGAYGYPFIPVVMSGDTVLLAFDTGNMAGLTLSSDLFTRLNLPCSDAWDRLDSAGEVVSTGCTALGVRASLLGQEYDSLRVLEFFHETLPGLVGPGLLPGSRFTIDYVAGLLACDSLASPASVRGFTGIPLVRSGRHPHLILVEGEVNGRPALIEIDTGKSRTTVDRTWVEESRLEETETGVALEQVTLGPLTWSVESARVVNTSGISEGLPGRISVGIGSDLLRDFVVTVDYARSMLWVEDPGVPGNSP